MKDEDLEPFAVADGLLARIAADPGHLSDAEGTTCCSKG